MKPITFKLIKKFIIISNDNQDFIHNIRLIGYKLFAVGNFYVGVSK